MLSQLFAFLTTVAAGTGGALLGVRAIDAARAALTRAR